MCLYMHTYSEDRIRNGVKRIVKSRQGATQGRLDTFFKPVATVTAGVKRKVCLTLFMFKSHQNPQCVHSYGYIT